MDDYRYTQLAELDTRIEETKLLMDEPGMAELAAEELQQLQAERDAIQAGIDASNKPKDTLDERNIIFEIKGAAGGDEAKLFSEELVRMYTMYAKKKGFCHIL